MKKLALLCVLLALVASGCGKKKAKAPKSKGLTKSRSVKKNKKLALKDSEDFFDDNAVSDFAFVDDESNKNSKNKKTATVAKNDLTMPLEEINSDDSDANGVAFKTVHFDLNGNKIRSDQKDIVSEDSKLAMSAIKDGKNVVVHGHCCQLGSHSYNMALSQQRAEAIKQEMVAQGVKEESIKTVGYGSEMPLVWSEKKNRSSLVKELAPNRRAEVMVN